MVGGRNDVEIVGARARRIAAEEDVGAVLLESVVKGVEDLRRNELPRHENVGSLERLRLQHLRRPISSSRGFGRGIRKASRASPRFRFDLGIFLFLFL